MECSRSGRRLISLCASVVIHAAVVLAFLQPRMLGTAAVPAASAHSTEILALPVAMMTLVESPPPPGGSSAGPPVSAEDPSRLLQPISVKSLDPTGILIPFAPETKVAKESTVMGLEPIQCEVHVHQSPTGQIQAIDFGRCSGDAQWQHALMRAIEHAANLIQPAAGAAIPAVRTLTMVTDAPSVDLLARQLSADPDTSASRSTPD